jgi:hypothetical protein
MEVKGTAELSIELENGIYEFSVQEGGELAKHMHVRYCRCWQQRDIQLQRPAFDADRFRLLVI